MDCTASCEQEISQRVAECAQITLCQLLQAPHAVAYELDRRRKRQADSSEINLPARIQAAYGHELIPQAQLSGQTCS